ncbi:MAG: caspase family protein [Planctomycetota bacterium]
MKRGQGNQKASWRKSKTRPLPVGSEEFGGRGRERRKLLFRVSMTTTIAIALSIALAVALMKRPDKDVPLIVAAVTSSYERGVGDPLYTPPNPFALEDVKLLNAWFGEGEMDSSQNVKFVGKMRDRTGHLSKSTNRLISSLTEPLKDVVAGGPNGDMIALFVSAHGFVDDGVPYFAVGDSVPFRNDDKKQDGASRTWVSVAEFRDAIVSALEQRSSSGARVVLFLDASRAAPQWDWGRFSDQFSDACEQVLGTDQSQIAVVLSSSAGERSWWDPRAGNSLFTLALVEALTGRIDTNDETTLTLGEIIQHVEVKVGQRARSIWDAKQTPRLLNASAVDWEFISEPGDVTSPAIPSVNVDQLREDFSSVDRLWARHGELSGRTHPPLAFDPLGWSTLEKKLARLDALLLAGEGYRAEFQRLRDECATDISGFEAGPVSSPSPGTLPELALRDYFDSPDEYSPELKETIQAWREKPEIAAVQVPVTESQATRFLTAWLEDQRFAPESVALATQLLEDKRLVTAEQGAGLIESHLLRLLSAKDLAHLDGGVIATILQSNALSRQAVCAPDLRASFWIRDRLTQVNAARLSDVDRMLSRDASQQSVGKDEWENRTRDRLEALIDSADKISAAYRLRDEMLHGIPRIAETLMNDLAAFRERETEFDDRSPLVLAEAIESLSQLNEQLQLPEPGDVEPIEASQRRLLESSQTALAAFRKLRKRMSQRYEDVSREDAEDARSLRRNLALLVGSGTDDAQQRQWVHNRYCDLLDRPDYSDDFDPQKLTSQRPVAAEIDLSMTTIDGRHVWDHWLSATAGLSPDLVGAVTPAEQTDDRQERSSSSQMLAEAGNDLRRHAQSLAEGRLPKGVLVHEVMDEPIAESKSGAAVTEIRRRLAQWDTFLRSRTMLFSNSPKQLTPIGQGRFALDRQLFFYDHAARTMEEFWGRARPRDNTPFILASAQRLLATKKGNPFFSKLPANVDGLDLSKSYLDASQSISLSSTLLPQPQQALREGTLGQFVAGKKIEFTATRPGIVPSGLASVWSDDESVVVPLGAKTENEVRLSLTVPKTLDNVDAFRPNLFFRGLRREGSLRITKVGEAEKSVFRLPSYGTPEVNVVRENKEPERVLLVLDCSKSMESLIGGRSQLDEARKAINEFLSELVGSDVEVGLILFGHRYGFVQTKKADGTWEVKSTDIFKDRKHTARVLKWDDGQTVTLRPIVPDEEVTQNPNFNVENVLGIAPLTNRRIQTFTDELAKAGPVGVTPTWQALIQAYTGELRSKKGHVILLTDGEPKLISFASAPVSAPSGKAVDLIRSRKDIRLTVVEYRFGRDNGALQRKLKGLAEFETAADGDDLLRILKNATQQPEVVWQLDREDVSKPAKFGSFAPMDEWPPRGIRIGSGQPVQPAKAFSVRASVPDSRESIDARSNVEVEGGERFLMTLRGRRLVHRPYNYKNSLLSQRLNLDKVDQSRFQVHAGPEKQRLNRELTMRLAIESANGDRASGEFTPRPSDIWVEITGFNERSRRFGQKTYQFSLPEFKVREPIPILLCRIADFPDKFDTTEVRAWMRFGKESLPGTEIPQEKGPFTLPEVPGVTFRVERSTLPNDQIRISVVEQYSAEQEPGSLRVISKPLPLQASTELFEKDRLVRREFDFDANTGGIVLTATTREAIQSASTLSAFGKVFLPTDSR